MLLRTIKNIMSAKARSVDRKLKIANCEELLEEQQLKLAENYKRCYAEIHELTAKLDELKSKIETAHDPRVTATLEKNIEIFETTLVKLQNVKAKLGDKLARSEESKTILAAKKSLLESMDMVRGMTSNLVEGCGDFDAEDVMAEIDKAIRGIESEIEANNEIDDLVKGK